VAVATSTQDGQRRLRAEHLREGLLDLWLHAGQVRAGSEGYGSTKKDTEENAQTA